MVTHKLALSAAAFFLALSAGAAPLLAGPFHDQRYREWTTTRPFSGWYGVGPYSVYCDYIRYPVRTCGAYRTCRKGKCTTRRSCRITGWRIRQACY